MKKLSAILLMTIAINCFSQSDNKITKTKMNTIDTTKIPKVVYDSLFRITAGQWKSFHFDNEYWQPLDSVLEIPGHRTSKVDLKYKESFISGTIEISTYIKKSGSLQSIELLSSQLLELKVKVIAYCQPYPDHPKHSCPPDKIEEYTRTKNCKGWHFEYQR